MKYKKFRDFKITRNCRKKYKTYSRYKENLKEDFKNILDKCSPEQQKLIYEISELVCKTKFENVNN